MNNVVRKLVALFLAVCCWALVLLINYAIAVGNYMSIQSALYLSNFEMRPLAVDELVGTFAGVWLGQATLAHWYALAMAVTVSVGLFIVCNRSFHVFDLMRDRSIYLREDDREGARAAVWQVGATVLTLVTFLIPLVLALRWDIGLFRFRAIAWATGLDADPAQAVQLLNWEGQQQQNGDLFVWWLADIGAWGYVALTVLAAVGLDHTSRRVVEIWARLWAAGAEMWNGWIGDTDAEPVEEYIPAMEPTTSPAAERERVDADKALFDVPNDEPQEQPTTDEIDTPQPAVRPVIGTDETVTLEQALQDPTRYRVDPDDQQVWDVELWNSLFGTSEAA